MLNERRPPEPIPDPLRGAETGTFTHHSVAERLPQILTRTLAENTFGAETGERLIALREEIPGGKIRPLRPDAAPDSDQWEEYVAPYAGKNWLEVPWFFVEHYFYRRILEAVDYFAAEGERGPDPFAPQKQKGLTGSETAVTRLTQRWRESLEGEAPWGETMAHLLRTDLWGNQGDLSMWPAGRENGEEAGQTDQHEARTLVDDTAVALEHLRGGVERIDILVDNAGFELAADLALAAYLLATDTAVTLRLHAKLHPVFVSDATVSDVHDTIDFLATAGDAATGSLGKRLQAQREDGRLRLRTHPFWTSPLPGWQLAPDLRHELLLSNLVISKGDAHYRRLLGDRHWPYTMPFGDIVSYFPAPLLALRTLKSEVAAGIPPERLREAEQVDSDWLVSGEWGMIQIKK